VRFRHPARAIALAAGAVVVVLAIVLATQVGSDPQSDATTSRLLGEASPTYSLPTLDGSTVSSAGLEGKAVIINFWNSWCIPCQEELPTLQAFYGQHSSDADFAMVGIVRDDTTAAVRAYVRAEGIGWTVALDPDAEAALAFGTRGQPETFAISPDGHVAGYQYGPTKEKDLEAMLAAARVSLS